MPPGFLIGLLLPVTASLDPAAAATVWVRVGDRTTGTGWVVDRDRRWVVTAKHVLGDQTTAELAFHTSFAGLPVTDREAWVQNRSTWKALGRVTPAKVVATAATADLILLQADHLPADVPALRLVSAPEVGTRCHCVGHRHDAPILWVRSDGYVRQTGRLTDGYFWAGRKIGTGATVLLARLPVELGDSGAAVVDALSGVVGVVSAISERTSGLTILSAAGEVQRLLDDARGDKSAPPAATPDPPEVQTATAWVRPRATDGRYAGVVIDRARKRVLTSASAVGSDDVTDVILPVVTAGRLAAEADAYADRLGLILSGHQVRATVLARDPGRDLALLELRDPPPGVTAVPIATTDARVGDAVRSVSHPPGVELMWLFAAGSVRGIGNMVLQADPVGAGVKVPSLLLQLPNPGRSSGGPIVNDRGELVGILSARDGVRQELAFAATTAEVRAFLKAARPLAQPQTAVEWLRRGDFLSDRGDRAGGREAYRQAAALAPKDAIILARFALALTEPGSTEDGPAAFAAVERIADRPAEAEALLALAYSAEGRRNDARRAADRALAADPTHRMALVLRSRNLSKADALRDLENILMRDPAFAPAYLERAERLRSTEEGRGAALADATRAVELAPHDFAARSLRAQLLGESKEWKKAAREFARLVEDRPRDTDLRARLIRAHLRAGEDGSALEALAEVVRLGGAGRKVAFSTIREQGAFLLGEDHGDATRAFEWPQRALQAVRPRLAGDDQRRIDDLLRTVEKVPPADAVRRVADELERWGNGK